MSEKLCILDEWFYKPHQFCQVEVEKGEINEYGEVQKVKTQSTVFTRNACNVLMQHVHNEIEKCENKDSIKALNEVINSNEIKTFINEKYQGSIIEAF